MPHVQLFVILAVTTGARMGALLGLTWDRVDFEGGTIDLNDPTRAQTKKHRPRVPMNATARAALSEAREGAQTRYVIRGPGSPSSLSKRDWKPLGAVLGCHGLLRTFSGTARHRGWPRMA